MRTLSLLFVLGLPVTPLAMAGSNARTCSLPQTPAPLPQPKPIVTRPMPRPGQFSRSPKAPAEPVNAGSTELIRKEASPTPRTENSTGPKQNRAGETKAQAPSYGTTPVPWPKGSTDQAHFPKEIPKPPNTQSASFSMSAQVASACLLCAESPEQIAAFYLDFAAREHWTLVPIPGPPLESERIVIAEKGDWTLRVDASPDPFGGPTEVFLCASLKLLPPAPKPAQGQPGGRR